MDKARKVIFVTVEAVLYICFMYCDITDRSSGVSARIKYASILLCAGVAIFAAIKMYREKCGVTAGGMLLAAAMIFTAISDSFLLFGDVFLPGLISFCVVQTVYLTVIEGAGTKRIVTAAAIRLVLCSAAVILLSGYARDERAMLAAAAFYGISFAGNIIRLIRNIVSASKKDICLFKKPGLFLLGMVTFLLCDVNVLLYNIGGFVSIDTDAFAKLTSAASILMWAFYLPSQVMIVLSGTEDKTGKIVKPERP